MKQLKEAVADFLSRSPSSTSITATVTESRDTHVCVDGLWEHRLLPSKKDV